MLGLWQTPLPDFHTRSVPRDFILVWSVWQGLPIFLTSFCPPKWCGKTLKKFNHHQQQRICVNAKLCSAAAEWLLLSLHTCKHYVKDSRSGCDCLWPCLWGYFHESSLIGESRPTGVTPVHLGCATPEQEVLVVEENWLSWSQRAQAKSSIPLFLLRHSLTALDFCCVPLLWLPWMTECNQWTEISPLLPWVVWYVVHHISWNQTKAVKKEGQSSTPL